MGRTPISRLAPSRRGPQFAGRAGTGTPTSGRHSPPQAGGGKDPDPPDGPLSAWTPAAQVARRHGNADLWRSPAGTARRRRADGRTPTSRMAPLQRGRLDGGVDPSSAGGAQARERRPLASSPGGGRHSPPQAGGWEGPRSPGWLPCRRGPQQRRWRAGTGTPTSGQFSRWGPAQPAAGGRREGPRPPGWPPSRRGPQQRRWRAGKGTPTSGGTAARRAPRTAWTPSGVTVPIAAMTPSGVVVFPPDTWHELLFAR